MSIFTPVDSSKIQSQKWNPESLHSVQSILDMEKYNGRINLMDLPDKDTLFNMFEKVAIKNKSTEYRNPVVGILEDNILAKVFFQVGIFKFYKTDCVRVYTICLKKKKLIYHRKI